jgi:hypothetical protein
VVDVDLLGLAKKAATAIPQVMDGPESGWIPILMYEDADGCYHTAAIPDLTRETIRRAAGLVQGMLTSAHAVKAVIVLNTTFTELEGEGVEQSERVMATLVTRDGTTVEAALVLRGANVRPRLGPWDPVAEDSDVGRGPFVDAMRAAIR